MSISTRHSNNPNVKRARDLSNVDRTIVYAPESEEERNVREYAQYVRVELQKVNRELALLETMRELRWTTLLQSLERDANERAEYLARTLNCVSVVHTSAQLNANVDAYMDQTKPHCMCCNKVTYSPTRLCSDCFDMPPGHVHATTV